MVFGGINTYIEIAKPINLNSISHLVTEYYITKWYNGRYNV